MLIKDDVTSRFKGMYPEKKLLGLYPQIYTVLNFGMTIFNFHLLLMFLANLTRNWVIFDEKMERQA